MSVVFVCTSKVVFIIAITTGGILNELLMVFQEHESTGEADERVWGRILRCKSIICLATLIEHTLIMLNGF